MLNAGFSCNKQLFHTTKIGRALTKFGLKKRLPRPLVETGPCNLFASSGKLEKSNTQFDHKNSPKTCQSLLGVGSAKLARGFVRKSTNNKVRSEVVGLFGVSFARSLLRVRSFVRSSEFVRNCSEFVRSLFGLGSRGT